MDRHDQDGTGKEEVMRIEITKPSGRARCFICGELIAHEEIQLRIHQFGGYAKSMHGSCVQAILDRAASKNYGSKSKECTECGKLVD